MSHPLTAGTCRRTGTSDPQRNTAAGRTQNPRETGTSEAAVSEGGGRTGYVTVCDADGRYIELSQQTTAILNGWVLIHPSPQTCDVIHVRRGRRTPPTWVNPVTFTPRMAEEQTSEAVQNLLGFMTNGQMF